MGKTIEKINIVFESKANDDGTFSISFTDKHGFLITKTNLTDEQAKEYLSAFLDDMVLESKEK